MEPETFFSRALCFSMISYNCVVWNVCGLNGHARRNVVRDLANTKFFHHMAEGDVLVNEEDVMECWMRKRKLVVKPAMAGDCGRRGTRALLMEFLLTRLV